MPKSIHCPKCGSFKSVRKHGRTKKGIQRYRYIECSRTFILNESPLKHLHISNHKFKLLIGYMIDDVALDEIARNMKINIKTAHYYRYLVFHSLLNYPDKIRLSGTILIDETFIRIKEKKYVLRKLDVKGYRGLSFNQLCFITLLNLQGLCISKVSSRAMALPDDYKRLCNINIGKATLFIHDGNPKQKQFMRQFKCDNVDDKRDITGEYTTDIIDSLHSDIKRYLFKHSGFKLKNLQHYLNFFVYRYNFLIKARIDKHTKLIKTKNQMIEDLFNKVIQTKKTVTYKTYLNDEGILNVLKSKL